VIWSLIAATGVIDGILLATQGMTVGAKWPAVTLLGLLWGTAVMFRRIPSISLLLVSISQICAFTHIGAILTYAATAASPFPLADSLLSRADNAIGFNWPAWFDFINANPRLHSVLAYAYLSASAQVFALLFYFSYADGNRVHEVILAGILSILLIVPIMVLLPALGAWSQYGIGMAQPWRHDILGLRAHTLVEIGETVGIVSFPSFHTVLAVLFINMARGRTWFVPALILNLLMIASVPTEGAHYGVDVVSGLAVAFVALAVTRCVLARCSGSVAPVASEAASTDVFGVARPSAIRQSIPTVGNGPAR